jgi:hypothetical protein
MVPDVNQPDELIRQILGPRPLNRPAPAPTPPPKSARRTALPVAAGLALLVAAGAGGWFLHSAGTTTPQPAIEEPVPRRVAPAAPRAEPPQARAEPAPPVVPAIAPPVSPREGALAATATPRLALAELLQRPPSSEWRWSRFKANPAIVVIEYPNLRDQGLAMNRLAAMFEKRFGRRDRVLSASELDALLRRSGDSVATFFQGHDYPAAKVARFFSQAEAQRVTLNAEEVRLRALLLEAGLLQRGAGGAFQAVDDQAVVSFTAVQDGPTVAADERVDSVRREAVLRHELSHGVFFVDAAYRAHCMRFWRDVMSKQERKVFTAYLKSLDYNPADEELMANETQALLMHTPDSRAFDARSVGMSESALADLRTRFRVNEPPHGLRD